MKKAIFIFIFSFVFILFGCSFIADSDSGNNPSNTIISLRFRHGGEKITNLC